MLKGERNLSRYLTNWLREHDFDCVAKMGTDFAYWLNDDTITYSLIVCDNHDRLFRQVANELGILVDCDNFILSFFHEVGHYETIAEVSDRDNAKSERVKDKMENKNGEITDGDCWTYYHLPDEIIATEWAVNYINEHISEIKEFWENVQQLIFKIYELNEVVDE